MNRLYPIRIGAVLLALLLFSALIAAQDETADEDLPEIEVYRSSESFNVPILPAPWTLTDQDGTAIFEHTEFGARIEITAPRTLDDDEAIAEALRTLGIDEPGESLVDDRIGIPNGTWTQQVYSAEDTSISALALVRRDRTFVMTLVEESPAYDAYHLAVRTPIENVQDVPQIDDGIALALDTLFSEPFPDDASREIVSVGSGDWLRLETDERTIAALQFGGITYTLFVTGDVDAVALADAFNTVFLGFFITPENDGFLYLGLGVTALIFVVFLGSMWIRQNNAKKDLALIEELARDDNNS